MEPKSRLTHTWGFSSTAGLALVLFGILVLIDQYARTGWLFLTIPFLAGLILAARGFYLRQAGSLIAAGILLGSGAGFFTALSPWLNLSFQARVSYFLLLTALGWVGVFWMSAWGASRYFQWALIPAGVSGLLGSWFLLTPLKPVDYVLYLPAGLGVIFLICGVLTRKFGLIIPGCILASVGPGIFFAWGVAGEPNGLSQTGIMLVTFALGWGLITLFSRVTTDGFVWWPLIPGGILAMVGWGLYIGGNPNNALSFIGNTGSVGLVIFGVYLLLWRNDIRR
jgi:hypothetical protein